MQPLATTIHPFPRQKLLYVEVPKAGSTSVKTFLSPLLREGGWTPRRGTDVHQWMGYTFVRSEDLPQVIRRQYRGWTVFTVVRHPVSRFRSLLFDKLVEDPALMAGLSQASLLSDPEQMEAFMEHFSRSEWYLHNHHGRPQTSVIGTDLSLFDFVGRSEDMEEVFAFLGRFMEERPVSAHENRSPGDDSWQPPASVKKRIGDLYAQDFKILGYDL